MIGVAYRDTGCLSSLDFCDYGSIDPLVICVGVGLVKSVDVAGVQEL